MHKARQGGLYAFLILSISSNMFTGGLSMKKRIAFVMTVILLLCSSFSYNATATEVSQATYQSTISICQERAELFLQNIGHPATASNPIVLKNFVSEPEAILFTTGEKGYIVVNINDLSIPELSLVDSSPFYGCTDPVYNGPLEYYYEQDGVIKLVVDDTAVDVESIEEYYTKVRIDEPQDSLIAFRQDSSARRINVERYLSAPLQEWYVSGDNCGSIASAICMRWYYDNVDYSYVNADNITQSSLIYVMQGFVGSGRTNYNDIVNGLNSYFETRNVTNSAAKTSTFSFSRVKQSIFADRPIIVGTKNHPTFGNH